MMLEASGEHFFIRAKTVKGALATLVATRTGRFRLFSNPMRALTMLHAMGVERVEFTIADWQPNLKARFLRRPDQAVRLREVHKAAKREEEAAAAAEQLRVREERTAAARLVLGWLKRAVAEGAFGIEGPDAA